MPTVRYFVGLSLNEVLMGIGHWIAFGLLAFIGVKMIYDSTKKKEVHALSLYSLLIISVVTSVDTLMVGLSLAFIQTEIFLPVLLIELITFLLSFVGYFFGCRIGRILGERIRLIGGSILIAVGIRMLFGA